MASCAKSSEPSSGRSGMFGSEASKLGNGRSKSGSGRLKGETDGSGDAGSCGVAALSDESDGIPVKDVASVGKFAGMPEPERRAMSASLGILSMDGSDGMEGAGTPNWGQRISVPGTAAVYDAGEPGEPGAFGDDIGNAGCAAR